MTDPFAEKIARQFFAREAIASIALSHREGCPCVVCRAAAGDMDAFAEISAFIFRDEPPIH